MREIPGDFLWLLKCLLFVLAVGAGRLSVCAFEELGEIERIRIAYAFPDLTYGEIRTEEQPYRMGQPVFHQVAHRGHAECLSEFHKQARLRLHRKLRQM